MDVLEKIINNFAEFFLYIVFEGALIEHTKKRFRQNYNACGFKKCFFLNISVFLSKKNLDIVKTAFFMDMWKIINPFAEKRFGLGTFKHNKK